MIDVIWNVQGLGNPGTRSALLAHVRDHSPDFIFLSETRLRREGAERVRVLLGFDGCMTVDCLGRSGGLMLLWKEPVRFLLGTFSRFHIEGDLVNELGESWRFVGIYGDPVSVQRRHTWELLRRLRSSFTGPWLVGGDMNEVASNSEIRGGRDRGPDQLSAFR
jgi:exonuclease III